MMAVQPTALYLCRLLLNPRSRQVRNELAHPYEMHRTLMRAFQNLPDGSKPAAREQFGMLFRADTEELEGRAQVLVQSLEKAHWSFVDEFDNYLCTRVEEPKNIMPAYQNLRRGQILRFRLRANPTKRVAKEDDPMKGKRVELARENEQIEWLVRKGAPGGFELLMKEAQDLAGEIRRVYRVNVCPEGKQYGRKRDEGARRVMMHLAVCFDGLLRVTNKDAFLETLFHGIGSGKAFGFGLLSVATL